MIIIVCFLTKLENKIKRMPGPAPSCIISLVLATLCMNVCIIHMYLSCRNATLFACAVKNHLTRKTKFEGLETEGLEGGGWGGWSVRM
jgi:hypothetical protein